MHAHLAENMVAAIEANSEITDYDWKVSDIFFPNLFAKKIEIETDFFLVDFPNAPGTVALRGKFIFISSCSKSTLYTIAGM